MKVYNITIITEWDDDSQTYNVTCPDIPEIFTFGTNLAEIQANVQEAIELLLEVLQENGEPRPKVLQPVNESKVMLPVMA